MSSVAHLRASRNYYVRHKKLCLVRTNAWRNKNKEKVANARKRLYVENPDKYRAQRRGYYERNAEKERRKSIERAKKLVREHPEKYLARKRKWYGANQDRNRNYAHNRRAKVREVEGGHFTDAEFQGVCNATGNKCLCCGRKNVRLDADHVVPLGPPHSDEISNIQPLCLSCNSNKHTKTIDYRLPYTAGL